MTFKVGEILEGREILTGRTKDFAVVQVNRKSVDIQSAYGNVHRVKPDENGVLRIMHGKDVRFTFKKKAA